ncbi:protein huluwa-like [Hyperolius riggenbachi]|uniref:protein huluwa-like n=1 Tax=Hyperolius riggenbachi TaxID=752182 RepID=UPI0035A395DD
MVSIPPSVFPLARGVPSSHDAPLVEGRLPLQPSLALLVFILIPCVLLLFFLNCFLLLHRLPILSLKKRDKRRGGQRGKSPWPRTTQGPRSRVPAGCLPAPKPLCDGCYSSISHGLEATLALGECANVSQERIQSRDWFHRLEETPERPSSLHPLWAGSSRPCSLSRSCGTPQDRGRSWNEVEDDGGGMRSSSDEETRCNVAPPNTPSAALAKKAVTPKVKFSRKTSTQRKRPPEIRTFTPLGSAMFENASSILSGDTSTLFSPNSSLPGPGLDSDFGVSAGISLHILSSDSDSGSHSWTSGMEWDYYDPCYMRKNRLRMEKRQNQNLPVICSKQYWV